MNRTTTFLTLALAALALTAQAQKKTLGITGLTVNSAVTANVQKNGNELAMQRVVQSLNEQILAAVQGTRRFELITLNESDQKAIGAASDYNALSGVDAFDDARLQFILTTQINDFQDFTKRTEMGGLDQTVELRTLRLGCVAKIISVDKGRAKIYETANFQIDKKHIDRQLSAIDTSSGRASDEIILQLSREMGERIARRVLDVLNPATILAKTGQFITINRGDGTDIAKGQMWEVLAVGEELIDPDTGESLGREEIPVGKAEIIAITPKFSRARLIEDYGVEKGHVARPMPAETSSN